MRIGTVDFPVEILSALREERLVVFAGAGVSMGPPSNLPSFESLAVKIAAGTGNTLTQPIDRFLGDLQDAGVHVHARAVSALNGKGSQPCDLHSDLLRLFPSADRVRLITTNFDAHFESAADRVFGVRPPVYCAPALPSGRQFTGIVHVHGALESPQDMILTDADFGRAYLIDGWARRFLVEAFRRHVVLFVGYSHDDVVMHYLARALQDLGAERRFALTDTSASWSSRGIAPIVFAKHSPEDFTQLYAGVGRLADLVNRSPLEWQSRLQAIGSRPPPADDVTVQDIDFAMLELRNRQFLRTSVCKPEWLDWLSRRGHLDDLFGPPFNNGYGALLARWLATKFAWQHSEEVLDVIAGRLPNVHPGFWQDVVYSLPGATESPPAETVVRRWVSILLEGSEVEMEPQVLQHLAIRCVELGYLDIATQTFVELCRPSLHFSARKVISLSPGVRHMHRFDRGAAIHADAVTLSELWDDHLRPRIGLVAGSVLRGLVWHLERFHTQEVAWGKGSTALDTSSYSRRAIEKHESNDVNSPEEVVIDTVRDCLDWLALSLPAVGWAWIELLVVSHVPLLRRLAIHTGGAFPGRSADERLRWLLTRVSLHAVAEHHELYMAVAANYAAASDDVRRAVIEAIVSKPTHEPDQRADPEDIVRDQLDWLRWVIKSAPECKLLAAAFEGLHTLFPQWAAATHPEFLVGRASAHWVGSRSPLSVHELGARSPGEQLDELLAFDGREPFGPSRHGLLSAVREACTQSHAWATGLADALAERGLWGSDIWPSVFLGTSIAAMPDEGAVSLLRYATHPEVLRTSAHSIVRALLEVVRVRQHGPSSVVLDAADAVAHRLWQLGTEHAEDASDRDWLERALNHPAGLTVTYWLQSLDGLAHGAMASDGLPLDRYRSRFVDVVKEPSVAGGLGRSVLMSQVMFLYAIDPDWTDATLIPLLEDCVQDRFHQAWSGLLRCQGMSVELGRRLIEPFRQAASRINELPSDLRQIWVGHYAELVVRYEQDPIDELIPALFRNASDVERAHFAGSLTRALDREDSESRQAIWVRWLRTYWENRLEGVPRPLAPAEVERMLDWLPLLGDHYPEAVSLAVRSTGPLAIVRFVHKLRKTDLPTRYVESTVDLSVWLVGSQRFDYGAKRINELVNSLGPLPVELRQRVDEAFARAGFLLSSD